MKLPSLFILLCAFSFSLFGEDVYVLYARKAEFHPNFEEGGIGRIQIIESNRALTFWKSMDQKTASTLQLRDFIRDFYLKENKQRIEAELVFLSAGKSRRLSMTLYSPYYNRFSNVLTFDYQLNPLKTLLRDREVNEITLIMQLEPLDKKNEN